MSWMTTPLTTLVVSGGWRLDITTTGAPPATPGVHAGEEEEEVQAQAS